MVCLECNGVGTKNPKDIVFCSKCNGSGRLHQQQGNFSVTTTCPQCYGTAKENKNPCKECSGTGFLVKNEIGTIKIPKGIRSLMKLKKKGAGHQNLKKEFTDLICIIKISQHPFFKLTNTEDVYIDLPVPLHFFLAGGEIEVPTLHGKEKHILPPMIGLDYTFNMGNLGFPKINSDSFGNQIVHCHPEFPKEIPEEVLEKIKEIPNTPSNYGTYHNILCSC